jgi:hypothetical protein
LQFVDKIELRDVSYKLVFYKKWAVTFHSRSINEKSHACLEIFIIPRVRKQHERYYKYFAKHKCDFSLILREQV